MCAHVCADIDECLEGNHNCSEYADCENTHGEFNCKCYTGHEGDGVICESIRKYHSSLTIKHLFVFSFQCCDYWSFNS